MNDPDSVEKEVEKTLSSLHERHRLLQVLVESRRSSLSTKCINNVEPNIISESNKGPVNSALEAQLKQAQSQKYPIVTFTPSNPNFGTDELIALQVLGNSLKRDTSQLTNGHTHSTKKRKVNHMTLSSFHFVD